MGAEIAEGLGADDCCVCYGRILVRGGKWGIGPEKYLLGSMLRAIEEKLDPSRFMRIHKSFIIAMGKIDSIQKTQLVIQGREIPIGEGYRAGLQRYLDGKNLGS